MGRDIPGVPGWLFLFPTPPLEDLGGREAEAADHGDGARHSQRDFAESQGSHVTSLITFYFYFPL